MYRFYLGTYDRKWGFPYLNGTFFSEVFRTMRDRVLFVLARDALTRRPVAGALFFFRAGPLRALLGRRRRAEKSALRALLLPGDRVRDRAPLRALRGRRAGSTSSRAASCPRSPTARTTSGTQGSDTRSSGISSGRGSCSPEHWPSTPATTRTGADTREQRARKHAIMDWSGAAKTPFGDGLCPGATPVGVR